MQLLIFQNVLLKFLSTSANSDHNLIKFQLAVASIDSYQIERASNEDDWKRNFILLYRFLHDFFHFISLASFEFDWSICKKVVAFLIECCFVKFHCAFASCRLVLRFFHISFGHLGFVERAFQGFKRCDVVALCILFHFCFFNLF